jgi:Mrp family chromosome partitioning ATPase/capsular polysaccharide biosynthesis protein
VQSSESGLRDYLQIIKRQAWLIILVPWLTVGATYAFLATQDPVYRASMTLVVGEQRGIEPPTLGDFALTRTLTTLLEGDLVARRVIRRLDLNVSEKKFQEDLRVSVLPDTAVLDVSYDSTDRQLALDILSQLDRSFRTQVAETLGVRTEGQRRGRRKDSFDLVVRMFDRPHVEPGRVSPNAGVNLIFAGVAGLALGLMLGVARDALDARLRNRKDAEDWFGAPVIGALPRETDNSPPLIGSGGSSLGKIRSSRRSASLDLLRARLQFAHVGLEGPTILVAGAGPRVGKSSVVANLGAALARTGKRVVCVDADVRSPSLLRHLGLDAAGPGLVEVLKADADLTEALRRVELFQAGTNGASASTGRLEALPPGNSRSALVDVLTPDALSTLMETLRTRADFVVFDSPPLAVADAYPLAIQSDNVLVVARRGRTTKDQAEWVRTTLDELGIGKIGVVLTNAPADGYG